AGRRGWLFCLPLLLILAPQPSYALSWDDLWLRPDQQGQRLLEADRPREAAERFRDPQWQGEALYRAGDYAGAAERFAREDSAIAHYNRGNALARDNQLEAALDAYDQALERNPGLQPAQQNKALVEELLRQQKQQQQQSQQQDQEQQQQEQQDSQAGQPQQGGDQQRPEQQHSSESQPRDQQPAQQDQPSPPEGQSQQGRLQSGPDAGGRPEDSQAAGAEPLDGEQRDALEQWLRQIPDDPGELLRRKFLYEQQQRQEQSR